MKTIILFFCLMTCAVLQAQTPLVLPAPTIDPADPAAIELARQATRNAIASGSNVSVVTTVPVITNVPVVVNVPTVTNVPIVMNVPVTNTVPLAAATNRPPAAFPAFPAINRRARRGDTNAATPGLAAAPGTIPSAPPLSPPPSFAPLPLPKPVEVEPADVDINFPSVDLATVLDFYGLLVKRTILQATLPAVTINLRTQSPLTKTEAIQALTSVLAMNNITVINVGEKFVKVVQADVAGKQGAPFTTTDENQLPESDQYITHIVQLKYAKTTDILPAITPLAQVGNGIIPLDNNGIIIIRDYASNVKRMLELIKQIDVTVPLDFESEVIPIKYGKAEDIASALSSLGAGGGTSIGHGASTGARPAGTTGGLGSTGYGSGMGTGGLGSTPGITQPGGLGGGGGGSRTQTFAQRVGNLVSKAANAGEFTVFGQTKIIADERTNSLLVFASKQDLAMIKSIIEKLDIVLAQVLIESVIMEVTLDNSRTLGVSYLQNNSSTAANGYFTGIGGINNGTFLNTGSFNPVNNNGTNASGIPSGLSYFANFGGDFQATLTAIAADDRIQVLSRPRIQTSHGVAASLQVGNTVPEVTGTYFGGINGQASSQYQQTFVGINLTVTPLINPDGLVVMDIMQDVEQLGPTTLIDGNAVPTTSKRTAQATVSVRDRDTIILGGMISNSKSTSHSGVPFLKDIPGLGYLFRSSVDSSERVELVVLIHPTVLPTPEVAALVTAHEREKLPAIKAAEAESRLDSIRRQKEADKIVMPKERD